VACTQKEAYAQSVQAPDSPLPSKEGTSQIDMSKQFKSTI